MDHEGCQLKALKSSARTVIARTMHRSLLFTPATRTDRAGRLAEAGADAIILDLEDAVSVPDKERARIAARELTASIQEVNSPTRIYVRINRLESPWFEEDVSSLPEGIAGILVPKVSSALAAEMLADLLPAATSLTIVAGVEDAVGVRDVERILSSGLFRALYFGAEDFVTSVRGRRTTASYETLYARSRVVVAARAAGASAFDQAYTTPKDDNGFRIDADVGRALGFDGKLCIHPRQVALANAVFSPNHSEVALARRTIHALQLAEQRGSGVAVVDEQMVDEAMARRAHQLLASSRSWNGEHDCGR